MTRAVDLRGAHRPFRLVGRVAGDRELLARLGEAGAVLVVSVREVQHTSRGRVELRSQLHRRGIGHRGALGRGEQVLPAAPADGGGPLRGSRSGRRANGRRRAAPRPPPARPPARRAHVPSPPEGWRAGTRARRSDRGRPRALPRRTSPARRGRPPSDRPVRCGPRSRRGARCAAGPRRCSPPPPAAAAASARVTASHLRRHRSSSELQERVDAGLDRAAGPPSAGRAPTARH